MITKYNIKITDDDKTRIISAKQRLFSYPKTEEETFYELCFCICSPQTNFSKNIKLNKELKEINFFHCYILQEKLEQYTTKVRFYRNKAQYLMWAKKLWPAIWKTISRIDLSDYDKREWLVKNVTGMGMKTSSHFLRNILGCEHFAILDTHICKFMMIKSPHSQTMYKLIENNFQNEAEKLGLSPLELDLYLFSHYSGIPLGEVR